MKIEVRVISNAKHECVEEVSDGVYKVKVQTVPEGGKANSRVVMLLAKHLGISERLLTIVRGAKSRTKIIEVAKYNDK